MSSTAPKDEIELELHLPIEELTLVRSNALGGPVFSGVGNKNRESHDRKDTTTSKFLPYLARVMVR